MEHREAELREVALRGESAEDPARFLRDLRQLRDEAGLGHAELAARAHYPCEAIRAAEAGPALPNLPVLSAYVRSCGGTVAEWEERWRTLTRSPALPLLSARTAGCSDAATAGARIGSVSLAADGHDPSFVMAALSRVANGITAEPSPHSPSPVVPAASLAPVASAASAAPAASLAPVAPAAPAASLAPAAPAAPAGPEAPPARDAAAPEPGSLFGSSTQAPAADANPAPLIIPSPGSDPVPGASPIPGASAVPAARLAPHSATAPTPGADGPQARSGASPVSVPGRAADARRPLPSKPLIAAVVLVCLIAVMLALFA